MKLGTLKEGGRDGTPIVVSRDLSRAVEATAVAPTLQAALDDWAAMAAPLQSLYDDLNAGRAAGAFDFDPAACASPLPRAYQFVDGSSYLNHVALVRKARGASMPPEFLDEPLMYQGESDAFYGPRDDIPMASESYGIDFESEVSVIVDDTPMGATPEQCNGRIRLAMILNDVSLRGLIPAELAKGFGFLNGKGSTAFSPVAVTLDELGEAWRGGKIHLPLVTHWNGAEFGRPNAGVDMNFNLPRLISPRRPEPAGSAPEPSSAPARFPTSIRRTAIPASPKSAPSRRSSTASPQRPSWRSATPSGSRCSTPPAPPSSARSNSG